MVKRIIVEKKRGFDIEAQNLMKELRDNLDIRGIRSVRVFNRYDVENAGDAAFDAAVSSVFSEPELDVVHDGDMAFPEGAFNFGVEYLPGQYDQRADSAAQCIRLLGTDALPTVRYAKFISVDGQLSESEKEAIEKYCINPVDSREASFEKPDTLGMDSPEPQAISVISGFCRMSERALRELMEDMGLAMRYADIKFVQEYFKSNERRDPTITEIRVIDTYWSDHCRHTTFMSRLNYIAFEGGEYADLVKSAYADYIKLRRKLYGEETEKPVSLMDIATIGAKYIKKKGLLKDLDESDEINACSIKAQAHVWDECGPKGRKNERTEDWLVMFKNETHNHPTEIEPFGGAATCLGGAIRDPLSGRSYVYQAMRVTGSGDPRVPLRDTLPGKLAQYRITRGAAKGYSSYGNQIGLATGLVDEIYDERYVAKRMEIGAVIGAAPASHVRRSAPVAGDVIAVVGGRTGRDGIGGATGSSKEHTTESITTAGAEVQKGNPLAERDIQRLFRRREVACLIKKCNDFGAGGVSVAIGELADSIDVDLDKITKKYDGLDGTEIAISESQERMAVVLSAKDANIFAEYAASENVEFTQVAKVTNSGRFRMFWRGDVILDLSREFINTNGVTAERDVKVKNRELPVKSEIYGMAPASEDAGAPVAFTVDKKSLLMAIDDLNVCGKRGLTEGFDSTIGKGSVLMPLGGVTQLTPALGMAAKLPVEGGDTDTVSLMAYGFDPKLAAAAPFHGAVAAVVDSVAKIVCMGGDASGVRLTFQEFYGKLGKVPCRWGEPFSALLGALHAQNELGIPAIGGKDSMSGSFNHLDVPPTLVSFAVALTHIKKVISPEFKKIGSRLVLIPAPHRAGGMIDLKKFKANMDVVSKLIVSEKILSASTVGHGGIWAAVCKMAFGNHIGAQIENISSEKALTPSYGDLLLEIDAGGKLPGLFASAVSDETGRARTTGTSGKSAETARAHAAGETGISGATGEPIYRLVGVTTDDSCVTLSVTDVEESVRLSIDDILRRWDSALERVFPNDAAVQGDAEETSQVKSLSYSVRASGGATLRIARPHVLIPVFPGTNCEVDTAAEFKKAGADVEMFNFVNMTPVALEDSIDELAKSIKESQIIMIPGGFSAGDEPEGSAKFISAVFRNPYVSEAVCDLLEHRDGLMLGICNGFQALIKLGLVPFGRIETPMPEAPTLTSNTIGRHVSRIVRTRVSSVLSPWLSGSNVGDVCSMPVSHAEGRFVASDSIMASLIKNGQIATQYSDADGVPSMDISVNPNGSKFAVEGITSPDGRVFGKMGHIERVGDGLYKNVPGNYDSGIIINGVNYYK